MGPGLSVGVFPESDLCRLRLSGELAMPYADRLFVAGMGVLAERPVDLLIDLQRVTFIDSSGLNVLVQLRVAAERAGVRVLLRAVPPPVARLLTLTALAADFPVVDDLDEPLVDDATRAAPTHTSAATRGSDVAADDPGPAAG